MVTNKQSCVSKKFLRLLDPTLAKLRTNLEENVIAYFQQHVFYDETKDTKKAISRSFCYKREKEDSWTTAFLSFLQKKYRTFFKEEHMSKVRRSSLERNICK